MTDTFEQYTDESRNDEFAKIPRGLRDTFSDQQITSLKHIVAEHSLTNISRLLTTLTNLKIDEYQDVPEKDPVTQHELMVDRVIANKLDRAVTGQI